MFFIYSLSREEKLPITVRILYPTDSVWLSAYSHLLVNLESLVQTFTNAFQFISLWAPGPINWLLPDIRSFVANFYVNIKVCDLKVVSII